MSSLAHACLIAGLIAAGTAAAKETAMPQDPYAWLEDVTGTKALDWVKAQNAKTEARLADTPAFKAREAGIREVLDSDAKIPAVQKIGPYYYNLWKDRAHERGLWRRTTLDEYRKPEPKWETVLDLDALNKAEGENWVWHGANCLRPEYRRCLIALSRGGADADVTREFDLSSKQWIKDGFFRPEAKGGLSWIDADTVYLYTDFGPGSLTSSGYPRIVKQWKRGTPMSSATLVYEGKPDDMYIAAMHDDTPGYERDFVSRTLAFYNDEMYLRGADGHLTKIDVPNSANKGVHRQWLTLELRDPWTVGGTTYPAGALLATKFDDFMAGKRTFQVLFTPTETASLASFAWTKSRLVLNVLDDVKSRLWVLTPGEGEWARAPFPVGDLAFGSTSVDAVDADENDQVWLTSTDFLTPTTLMLADVQRGPKSIETLKAMPSFFDASKDAIEQHFAVSKDGTKVPYFLVRPKQLKADGSAPTLLYAYGGFEISMTPFYSGSLGRAWLDQGGVYALANIRGGGEYGPRWHQAALKQNRHKAYEDMAAVAQDLVARKITSAKHLGVQGGSNGGLMAGNMLMQYPQLFGAVVVQVPLLDMKRYSHLLAGASWMAEYGNPDTDDWKFIQTFSPYHLFDPKKSYPPVIFLTSTRDDRVHPGHARKMAAKMIDAGKDVTYYENIEGGHGGAANNAQAAHMQALAYSFLWERLSK
ncbi:prolyl oligopeptidase family serine peptidase [Xanthomonas rydalmerensis]|uniref:Prolyl oligopeptidase family serine peptidase n=1 Tax=Xanthomonas rydalmerensis TaxID=3046274 RepID=A0ABZ0JPL7_9XANT|nr:prolyl oligopeptidase family serine peptidase [Xanthomonas sp. DM-2023]WOS41600.1 prolyl oligopeptidase family serine peptidase [Xanthomonas sp. DM-2023]WOS45786.1 prolyl oligopeptidase family serine peptidase [Xanthomonas sp. DM-2023]WOS49965.1 prolyl oligopeptidase family serine peptidase [Xanthomonas sp. DM-2023]WOS54144.1 prolyl oligopeptidase family serine peptidase [Xanthomonas sp. DM-2023]WOS58327.1 prolyl oligopeptidase family serine peptidase [Xanthomonas sp. DM-2023]